MSTDIYKQFAHGQGVPALLLFYLLIGRHFASFCHYIHWSGRFSVFSVFFMAVATLHLDDPAN